MRSRILLLLRVTGGFDVPLPLNQNSRLDYEKLSLDLSHVPHVDAHMLRAAATTPAPLLSKQFKYFRWASRQVKMLPTCTKNQPTSQTRF